ncbi:MAG: ANTAR domain-containing protein [Syntrophomonadaceae bacterium]|jgi:response regulator NasT|nr:ANTAR domain-containing protein [Syntrophomonadaceae bacterium]
MNRILLASGTTKIIQVVTNFLPHSSADIISVSNQKLVQRYIKERDFDLGIINAPLPDSSGIDLALELAQASSMQIMLLAKDELEEKLSSQMKENGVLVLPKPLNRSLFEWAINILITSHNRLHYLQKQNDDLKQQIKDLKLIDRAKLVLITYLKITEPEAHRFIEKQAMDQRITKREICMNILKKYDY